MSVKVIITLPANNSTAIFCAPRRLRGLGLTRCQWEFPLQHWFIAQRLSNEPDALFQSTFDYSAEVDEWADRLGIDQGHRNMRALRQSLRENSFAEWANVRWEGIGVHHFKETPKGNRFTNKKQIFSRSDRTNALKVNINYAPLRWVPSVSG